MHFFTINVLVVFWGYIQHAGTDQPDMAAAACRTAEQDKRARAMVWAQRDRKKQGMSGCRRTDCKICGAAA
jgi:hypothetical protein